MVLQQIPSHSTLMEIMNQYFANKTQTTVHLHFSFTFSPFHTHFSLEDTSTLQLFYIGNCILLKRSCLPAPILEEVFAAGRGSRRWDSCRSVCGADRSTSGRRCSRLLEGSAHSPG